MSRLRFESWIGLVAAWSASACLSGSEPRNPAPRSFIVDRPALALLAKYEHEPSPPPVDLAQISWFAKRANCLCSEISGKLYNPDGSLAVQIPVYVVPATPYTAWLIPKIFQYQSADQTVFVDPTIAASYVLELRTGDDGYFFTQNMLPGPYYIFAFNSVATGIPKFDDARSTGVTADGAHVDVTIPHMPIDGLALSSLRWIAALRIPDDGGDANIEHFEPTVGPQVMDAPPLPKLAGTQVDFGDLRINLSAPGPDPAALAPQLAKGRGSITGTVTATLPETHTRKYWTGIQVLLIPAAPFSYALALSSGFWAGPTHTQPYPYLPAFDRFTRTVNTDQTGRFTFTNVPPGKYIVSTYFTSDDGSWGSEGTTTFENHTTTIQHDLYRGDDKVAGYTETQNSLVPVSGGVSVFQGCHLRAAMAAVVELGPASAVDTALAVIGHSADGACPD